MAIVFFTGFETGDQREFPIQGSTNSADSGTFYTGAYSLKIPAEGSGTSFANTNPVMNSASAYTRHHMRYTVTANPAAQLDMLVFLTYTGADALQLFVRISAAGALTLVLKNGVGGAEIGTFGISGSTWYLVETKTVISATVGILEVKVDGVVAITASNLNTGVANVTTVIVSNFNGSPGTLTANYFVDDLIVSDSGYIGQGGCLARQGKAGSPTYDAWTKNGAATAALCWSDTPFSAATNCTSSVSGDAQTMLTASFSSTQAGHGTEVITSSDGINACKVAFIAKVASGSSQSIRRRLGGSDTDTAKTLTTSDVYYDSGVFSASLTDINASEIGSVKGANATLTTVEDAWFMVDYTVGAGVTNILMPQICM